jgi:hypothetical protein
MILSNIHMQASVNSAIIETYIKDNYHGYKGDIKSALNVSEAIGFLCLQKRN